LRREESRMLPGAEPAGIREFLDELEEVADRRHLHLEAFDGHLLAVDDRPGNDPVPVEWDETLGRYAISEA
jgi:hypothetical protein